MTDPSDRQPPSGESSGATETQVVPMVLISQEQRNALIEYLAKMPYQDVAAGIGFLREAPIVNVTIPVPRAEADG